MSEREVDALLQSVARPPHRLIVRPMRPEDYAAAMGEGWWPDGAEAVALPGPAFAGFIDGRLAGVGGVTVAPPGVGHAWLLLTDAGRAHPAICYRAAALHLRAILTDHQLRRVQTQCLAEDAPARRWAERMGFHFEALLRRLGPEGEDMVQLVMFPEDGP